MGSKPSVRPYGSADLEAVITLYIRSIREVSSRDYNPSQINAWGQADRDLWNERRLSRPTWVAEIDQEIVGFTDLEPNGHLDMMYVHPSHQNVGIATALLKTVEAAARRQGLRRIFTESSITAKPFFERHGFRVLAEQMVEIRGQKLTNYQMEKILSDFGLAPCGTQPKDKLNVCR